MFKRFEFTDAENRFIEDVEASNSGQADARLLHTHNTKAIFYLAKQIEAASASNGKHTKLMIWLTGGLVFFGACQVAVAIIGLFN